MKALGPSFWKEQHQKYCFYNQEDKSKDGRKCIDIEFWPPGTHGVGKRTRREVCSDRRTYAEADGESNTNIGEVFGTIGRRSDIRYDGTI